MNAISEAVPLYLGFRKASFPEKDPTRLTPRFGSNAPQLERQVKEILAELNKIRPDWNAHDLVSGSQWAVAQLRRSHPELEDEAARALEWAYAWWWK